MSNSIQEKPAAAADYRWDRWTDGKPHRAWEGKHFHCSMEAFRRALSTHAGRRGMRVETRKLGRRLMSFQFFAAEATR